MGIVIDYTNGFFEAAPSGETVGDISTGTLDLSSGNVFSYTPTADTTFVFNNPPASGTAQGFTLKVTGADVNTSYDLANASYDSVSFSVAIEEIAPYSIFFKPDGLKMYVLGAGGRDVNEYDLSTAWDLSTASYLQKSVFFSATDTSPVKIFFKPDGTKMYLFGSQNDSVYEYNLSTAWDVTTLSFVQSFSFAAQDTNTGGMWFKPDGEKMYLSGWANDNVNEYNLSSAWDISTAVYSQAFNLSTQDGIMIDIEFNSDGTEMFALGFNSDTIYRYNLSTAWDISTASYSSVSFSVTAQETIPRGFTFKSDGTKLFVVGEAADSVFQYSTGTSPTPATLTYPTSVDWAGGTAPDAPADGETDVLSFYTTDGGTTYYGFQVGDAMA